MREHGEESPVLELEVRVLRKHIKARGLIFVDALLPDGDSGEPRIGLLVLSADEGASSLEQLAAWRGLLHAGNALVAVGSWGRRLAQPGEESPGGCVAFRPRSLELAEAHKEVHGDWVFTSAPSSAPPAGGSAEAAAEAGSPAAEVPPLPPVRLVLQVSGPHSARFADYCREALAGTLFTLAQPQHGCPDRALLLRPGAHADPEALLRRLAADGSAVPVLKRAFPVEPPPCWTLRGAVDRLAALARAAGPGCIVRVQVLPKYLQRRVVECLLEVTGGELALDCVRFTHVASVAYADAVYYVGLAPRALLCPDGARGLDVLASDRPRSPQICRASSKLSEALARSGWEPELAAQRPRRAVDVGAAPGGWSQCLASAWGCQEVFAVDPGELAPGLLEANCEAASRGAAGRIHHLRMPWEEAFVQLQEGGAVDALSCDANFPCDRTLDLVEAAACRHLLAPGAYVVLTFKNCSRAKFEFEQLKAAQLARLEGLCSGVREVQLLANRKLETTVLARFRGEAPAEARRGDGAGDAVTAEGSVPDSPVDRTLPRT